MTFHRTPQARLWRTGKWATILIAAALLLGLILALPVLSPVQAATSATLKEQLAAKQATLDQAYSRLDALQDELDKLAGAYNEAESNQGALEEEILRVQEKITGSERELQSAREQLEDRLVGMYKDGSGVPSYYMDVLFSEESLVSVFERFDALNEIAKDDQALFDKVELYLRESRANKALLEQKKVEQANEVKELQRLQDETANKLQAATAEYQGIKGQIDALQTEIKKADARAAAAAAARRAAVLKARAAAAAKAAAARRASNSGGGGGSVLSGSFTFPVRGAHSYVDSWGAARSGGRTHKGTDIMAPRGTTLVACVSGTITKVNAYDNGLGGRTVYLRGSNGVVYYYAHMNSVASGIAAGQYVGMGTVIGTVGNSGNASGGPCHLHFAVIVGGVYVNPYPTLKANDG
jgi:murein DD-endopeptidase MepM/ murein hydrolase activator NlpD